MYRHPRYCFNPFITDRDNYRFKYVLANQNTVTMVIGNEMSALISIFTTQLEAGEN